MILITLSCFVFIITQVVLINAEFVDISHSTAYKNFQEFGYTHAQSVISGSSSGNSSFTIPANSSFIQFYPEGTMYPTGPGGWVTGWHATESSNSYQASGTFNFSSSLTSSLSVPAMSRSGASSDVKTVSGFKVRTQLSYPDAIIQDALVISFYCSSDNFPGFSFTDSNLSIAWYDTRSGNMSLYTILIYNPSCPLGGIVTSDYFNISMGNRPNVVIPIYIGQLSAMPEDLMKISNLSSFTIDQKFLTLLTSINQSIVNGTSDSNSVSDALRDTAGSADNSISGLESQESDLIGDFNNNLISPDTSFISQLSTSANWVRNVFDSIVGIHPAFSGVLVVGLTIALALVIIGKMRG